MSVYNKKISIVYAPFLPYMASGVTFHIWQVSVAPGGQIVWNALARSFTHPYCNMRIYIGDLDKVNLLHELWHHVNDYDRQYSALWVETPDFYEPEAERNIAKGFILAHQGRYIKVDLSKDYADGSQYDQEVGVVGAFEKYVEKVRKEQPRRKRSNPYRDKCTCCHLR